MKYTAALRRSILNRTASVGVFGQGHLGLTLACAAAEEEFRVTGVDVEDERIADLQRGVLPLRGVDRAMFRSGVATGRITFTTDPEGLADNEIILICVPPPPRNHPLARSALGRACRKVARFLAPGRLVVLESTRDPGTMEDLVEPILETSGLAAGRDFLLAYSAERTPHATRERGLRSIPTVVRGLTTEGSAVAALFYAQLVEIVAVEEGRDDALRRMSRLTSRQREVFALLSAGADNAAIARTLGISPQTARSHVQNIFSKLGLRSRIEVAGFAVRNGLRVHGSGDVRGLAFQRSP